MFIATITVQSSVFKKEPSEDILQEIADEFLEEVHRLIREHGFEGEIAVEATWERGCVLEHFALFAANADAWISLATAAGGYKVLKEYKALREGALLITKDLMGFSKTIAGIPVKIVRSVISDHQLPRGHGEKLPDLHNPPKKGETSWKKQKEKIALKNSNETGGLVSITVRIKMNNTYQILINWDKGQAFAERMAAKILDIEGYSAIDPQSPVGGPDGTKDILCSKNDKKYVVGCYFPNGQKGYSSISKKFNDDFAGVRTNQTPIQILHQN